MKLLGITDENLGCSCCGRVDLKRYVAFLDDNENVITFGSTCATYQFNRKFGKLPKITIPKDQPISETIEIKGYQFNKKYNFFTGLYEYGMNYKGRTIPASINYVIEDIGYYLEDATEENDTATMGTCKKAIAFLRECQKK